MRIYAIGGLGADERVFEFLNLDYELISLQWINPERKESLREYANRMSQQILTDQPFVLIGVSFGGLLAVEISKIVSSSKVILISSVETASEIPRVYRLIGKVGLIKILPIWLLRPPKWLMNILFDAKNKRLLSEIIRDTDPAFLKWALQQLCSWRNNVRIPGLLNIIGSNDKLLPLKGSDRRFSIRNGGHFMIVDRAAEISVVINRTIAKFDLK